MNFLVSWGGKDLSDSVGSYTNSGKMKKKSGLKKIKDKVKTAFYLSRQTVTCGGHSCAGYSGKFPPGWPAVATTVRDIQESSAITRKTQTQQQQRKCDFEIIKKKYH